MNNYEVMYIVKPVEEEAYSAVVKKWGKKHLAYPIQDIQDGLYVLTTFSAEPAAVKELDRVMKITDEILRHMIIRKGE